MQPQSRVAFAVVILGCLIPGVFHFIHHRQSSSALEPTDDLTPPPSSIPTSLGKNSKKGYAPLSEEGTKVMQGKLLELSRRNPSLIRQFLEEEVPVSMQSSTLIFLLSEIGSEDLNRVPEILSLLDNQQDKRMALAVVAHNWAPKNTTAALRFASNHLSADLKDQFALQIAQELVDAKDIRNAIPILDSVNSSAIRSQTIMLLAGTLAQESPDQAFQFISSLLQANEKETGQSTLAAAFLAEENVSALEKLQAITESPAVNGQIQRGLAQLTAKNISQSGTPAEQLDRILAMPEGSRSAAISKLPISLMSSVPTIIESLKSPMTRLDASQRYAARSLQSSPKAAADWALSTPEDIRASVVSDTVSQWYDKDRNGAVKWASDLPGSRTKDYALAKLSMRLSDFNIVQARSVAAQISDPKMRKSSAKRLER